MRLITSISLSHINFESQTKAIQSWVDLGFKVTSINHRSEIDILEEKFLQVSFIEAKRTSYNLFAKHLIPIDLMIEEGNNSDEEIICLINSDIELINNKEKINNLLKRAENGICLVSRYNYENNREENSIEKFGLDMFCFHKKFAKYIPSSIMTVGRPLWDYWIPYNLTVNKVPIYSVHDKITFHKKHKLQWNQNQWVELSKEFRKLGHFEGIADKQLSGQIRRIIINGIKETIQCL